MRNFTAESFSNLEISKNVANYGNHNYFAPLSIGLPEIQNYS